MQFFRTFGKPYVGASTPGKSWIRHCSGSGTFHLFNLRMNRTSGLHCIHKPSWRPLRTNFFSISWVFSTNTRVVLGEIWNPPLIYRLVHRGRKKRVHDNVLTHCAIALRSMKGKLNPSIPPPPKRKKETYINLELHLDT